MEILILKVLTRRMHAMVELQLCSTASTGLRVVHGMDVMDLLFAQIVRYEQNLLTKWSSFCCFMYFNEHSSFSHYLAECEFFLGLQLLLMVLKIWSMLLWSGSLES